MTTGNRSLVLALIRSGRVGCDDVAAEGDVDVHVIAVDGVLALALVQAHPHLVTELQGQQDALTLHDGALSRLSVHQSALLLVLHNVHVGLLEVPRVHVHVEEVDAGNTAVELAGEHVEMAGRVDEDGVKEKCLVRVGAVEGFASTH